MPALTATPCAFLLAPSPGQVVQLLQRQFRAGQISGGEYRISSPLPPHGWRVLLFPSVSNAPALAELLSTALPSHPVTAVWREFGPPLVWVGVVFENGTETTHTGGPILPERKGLLSLLPGARRSLPPDAAWTIANGLPLPPDSAPVVDFVTVAQLDQRGLLVETGAPRWYRFTFD